MSGNDLQEALQMASEEKKEAVKFAWRLREVLGAGGASENEHYIEAQGALNKIVEDAELLTQELRLMQESGDFAFAA